MNSYFLKTALKSRIIWISVVLSLGITLFVLFFFFGMTRTKEDFPFYVRVRIMHNVKELNLEAKTNCAVKNAVTGDTLEARAAFPRGTKVVSASSGIKLGGKIFNFNRIRISPLRRGDLVLNGTVYEGELDVISKAAGLDVINKVELEDYLKGVLPREIHHLWPPAVMKAQAIASRSFAVYQALSRKNKDYDLTADAYSQVYGGKTSQRWRTTRAVEATKGKVLEYKGKVFPAYFHSSCGGHTEDISQIWGKKLKPLKGRRCSWCRWSPHFRWMARLSNQTILKKLKEKGYDVRRIDNIKAVERDRSGRIKYVSVKSGNKWIEIKTDDFRSAIGGKVLRSAKFRIKKYPFFYLFSGHGWGHGVGMCQWGAFGLSLRGWSAERILRYYYPGTEVAFLSEVLTHEAEGI